MRIEIDTNKFIESTQIASINQFWVNSQVRLEIKTENSDDIYTTPFFNSYADALLYLKSKGVVII